MTDENYNFEQARTRLEEIVTQVRQKDMSLEKSLDLLEEGVRLANICTEQSDHTEWRSVISEEGQEQNGDGAEASTETGTDAEPAESEEPIEETQAEGGEDAGGAEEPLTADASEPDLESEDEEDGGDSPESPPEDGADGEVAETSEA